MKSEVELVVIGDESVRGEVYTYMSKPLDRLDQNTGRAFPQLRANDPARDLGASTSTEFTHGAHTIRYGIQTKTNEGEFSSDSRSVLKDNLTVLVCIDHNSMYGVELERFNDKINQIQAIRGNQLFNLVPVVILDDHPGNLFSIKNHFSRTYPQLYRSNMFLSSDELNTPVPTELIKKRMIPYNISLATPIYNEVQRCIQLLETLHDKLGTSEQSWVTPLLDILGRSRNKIGTAAIPASEALKSYFNDHREEMQRAFIHLKVMLEDNRSDLAQHNDRMSIFINILCSVAALFVALTIIGIPFVCYALSQNSKYHNNYFKFFATNDIDKERASVVKVEDEVNRSLLSFT